MSGEDSKTNLPNLPQHLPERGLLSELLAFTRQHLLVALFLLLGPTLIIYAGMKYVRRMNARPLDAAPWTSEKKEFDSLPAFVEYRLANDPELERLRSRKPEPQVPAASARGAPSTDTLIVGSHAVAAPSFSDPGLARQVEAVLIDADWQTAAAAPRVSGSAHPGLTFHGLVEHFRLHRENPPRRSLVLEYSVAAELESAQKNPARRKGDFAELAGIANGRFFPVVAVFPVLDKPFLQYEHGARHNELAAELDAAGLRMLDILPYLSSLGVNDFHMPDSPAVLTPYGTRVYAHILAAYLECTKLVPSAVIVKDRSGCARPKPPEKPAVPRGGKQAKPAKASQAKPAAPAKPQN